MRFWAHRGSHGPDGPLENTMPAFVRALAEGDAIELDVHLSADGVPIVFHDETTGRLATGPDRALASVPAAELLRLPLVDGSYMPRLADVLDRVGPALPVNVEIKDAAALPAVLEVVRAANTPVLLSSFDFEAMVEAARLAPDVPRALVHDRLPEQGLEAALQQTDAAGWHPGRHLIDAGHVAICRRLGVAVRVWTVNDAVGAVRLAGLGVDGVFTDRPGALRAEVAHT